jgi:hypothetical protein
MNKVLEEKIDDLEDIYPAEKTLEEIRVGRICHTELIFFLNVTISEASNSSLSL